MIRGVKGTSLVFGFLACGLVLAGCNSGGAGGGGGGGSASLDQYQLGTDAELDADVASITTADNAALTCIGESDQFTDSQTLEGLKSAYTGAADGFPQFVDDTRVAVQRRADEICDSQLGDDPDLDAAVARLTAARNEGRECEGNEPNIDDENSLLYVKTKYLEVGLGFGSITAVAEALASDAEQLADDTCGTG